MSNEARSNETHEPDRRHRHGPAWTWRILIALTGIVLAFATGYAMRGPSGPELTATTRPAGASGDARSTTRPAVASSDARPTTRPAMWACAMPEHGITRSQAGKCPICQMELIPLTNHGSGNRMTFNPEAASLLNIETSPVERRYVEAHIRIAGKIAYDETQLRRITARVGGRLDRLYVDYTGVPVKQGDHMVELYSPELLSAQEELIQSIRTIEELRDSDVGIVKETAEATVGAVREKLRLWGLTKEQIDTIESRGTPSDHVTINAPIGGIVIEKMAQEGMYVQIGTRIYTIADLTHLWAVFDAYESDLAWLRYGQRIRFKTEAYPGETFNGVIAFIDPIVDDRRRTVKVRVNVPNDDGRLKPGMFVRGTVSSRLATGGPAMVADLAGKWICYMHPEIVKDDAGQCDICDMSLARAEDLGFVAPREAEATPPLIVPASAVLVTGKRAVVYVKVPDPERYLGPTGGPTFEGREIDLGPRAGAYYIVRGNLREGEQVVTAGNFMIDSAMQISGRPSMMNPAGGSGPAVDETAQTQPSRAGP